MNLRRVPERLVNQRLAPTPYRWPCPARRIIFVRLPPSPDTAYNRQLAWSPPPHFNQEIQ